MKLISGSILIIAILTASCRENVQHAPVDFSAEKKRKNESLIKMNNYVVKRNQELISQFVKRTGLDMNATGSGLWYGIYEEGDGNPVSRGDEVEYLFYLKLLDGTFVDSTKTGTPKSFRVGKGGVIAGLEEAMLLLHAGDRARFIVPPHLAFGNFGDPDRIPPGAFLFYDIHLLGIKP